MMTGSTWTQGVSYEDEYAYVNNKWLIANITSTFVWIDTKEMQA